MTIEKYLYAEKTRSAIRISTMRIFDTKAEIQTHIGKQFDSARKIVDEGKHSYFYPSNWFIWEVTADQKPCLAKTLMVDLRLRNADGETHSWDELRNLGIYL